MNEIGEPRRGGCSMDWTRAMGGAGMTEPKRTAQGGLRMIPGTGHDASEFIT